MSKRNHIRKHSKQSTKQKREEKREQIEKTPELSEEEYYANYRKNTRRTIYGILAIGLLIVILIAFVAIDVSGCQFVETEEEYENCQSYSLIEKILYGGAYQSETTENTDTEE